MIVVAAVLGALIGILVYWESRRYIRMYRQRDASAAGESAPVTREDRRLGAGVACAFALFATLWWWQRPTWYQFVPVTVTVAILGIITLVDLAVRRIPNRLVLSLFLWAVVQSLWTGQPSLAGLVLGTLIGGGLFLLIAVAGRGAMGMGDVKLAAALGAVLGYPAVLSGLFAGIIAGGLAALLLILTRRIGRKDYMAYGPYLALGAILILMS